MQHLATRVANTVGILLVLLLAILAVWFLYARIRMAQTETLPRTEAAPSGGIRFRAHDVDIQMREWGPRNGKPLLMVHGTGLQPVLAA